jgi:uncharacterized protein (DUF1778 family)
MAYNGYTEKKKASNKRYLDKLIKPTIRMTPEEKEIIENGAIKANKSFNRFMIDCAIEASKKI